MINRTVSRETVELGGLRNGKPSNPTADYAPPDVGSDDNCGLAYVKETLWPSPEVAAVFHVKHSERGMWAEEETR
ncbi:MAG: hypothetical protein ACI8TX_001569 [Hyphomicrobiaceae bacterium]|jgi:hypothetical protein